VPQLQQEAGLPRRYAIGDHLALHPPQEGLEGEARNVVQSLARPCDKPVVSSLYHRFVRSLW